MDNRPPATETSVTQETQEIPKTSKPPLLMVQTLLFSITFAIAVIGVPWYQMAVGFEPIAWIAFVAYALVTGISITGGYHRLWSHNAYKASAIVRFGYAIFGAATVQNSILSWVSGHRTHHRHVDDNNNDPYSAGRGLWFSHMGWMLRDHASGQEDFSNVKDLQRDKIVMWQHNHYVPITLVMNFGPPLLLGWITGDYLAHFLLIGFARLVWTHHTTFFINSLAHYWGKRPYTDENSARDNGVLAFFTYGEGYHNYHHRFQLDYRNGIRWFHFDPTKWLIFSLTKLGLASDLKRVPSISVREAQIEQQIKQAQRKLEQAPVEIAANVAKWRAVVEREYHEFLEYLEQWQSLKKSLEAKAEALSGNLERQRQDLERALAQQYRRLRSLNQMLPA